MGENVKNKRRPLSTEQVVEAAVRLADSHGEAALSMRKLAESLGSGVMSLYNHVTDKDDLLARMVEFVVAEIEPPSDEDEWKAAIRASAASAHAVLLAHPWAASQWSVQFPGPNRISYMESILRTLDNAGLPKRSIYHGYHAVTMHIVGFTLQALSYDIDPTLLVDIAEQFTHEFGTDRYPKLAEHVNDHLNGGYSDDFRVVLDYILEGIEASS